MKFRVISVVLGLIATGALTPVAAEPVKAADNLYMVAGDRYEIYHCAASIRAAELHYRIDRSWIRLGKSKVMRDSVRCKDRMLPFSHSFRFTVPMIYESIEPNTKYARMLLRTVGPQQIPKLFSATVFRSKAEKEAALGADIQSSTITNWTKCIYQGRFMAGRVKVVSYDANYRVQLVNQGANLLVSESPSRPVQCGQWQFVNQNYDFTVQLVNETPDFTITLVKTNGVNR